MLSKIIDFSIRNKLLVGLFVLGMIGYGVYQAGKLPIDAVPDITNNQVQVITIAPSYGATDIERLVTFPVEQACNNIHGILEIRSFSRFGLSLVTIVFDDETDIYWARQQVAERIQLAKEKIPKGIGIPELGPITTGLGEIYQYVVRPAPGFEKRYDVTELRTIQDWIVRRQLLGVEGVAEVSSFGGKLKQYEVAVNPNQLKAYGLSLSDIYTALEKNNQNTGGSYIEKGNTVLYIRSEGLITNQSDIGQIPLKSTEAGTPLFIRDVAEVRISHATRYGALCYNNQGEVAGAVVMMLKGANSNQVIRNIKERIDKIKETLPEGIIIEPFLDRSKMVDNAIGTVEKNLLEGALIVVFILVIFLGNLRAGLLVASVIPLSMLFAIILMNVFGVSGNLMSLGALDFGLIVDGAVIIVEAVLHQLSHHKKFHHIRRLDQKTMDKEVGASAHRMMNSAVFGQVIILIVYLPIFTLQGIEGKMFKPMAQTVSFALIGAFVLSLTYIPMMSSLVISKKIRKEPTWSDKLMSKLENFYSRILAVVLKFPKLVIATVLILFAGSLFVLSRLGGEFIPSLEEGDFAVDTRVLTGSSLQTTIDQTQKTAKILLDRFPEVEKVVTKIGSGEVPTDPMPMEASDMMVILKDKKEWVTAHTFNDLADTMGRALQDVPGITAGFQYPVQMRFNELMTGARQDVVCKIFGEDLDTLASLASKLGALVNKVKGSQDVYIETVTGIPQIVVNYKRPVLAQYNLHVEDVNQVLQAAFAGQVAGQVFEGERRFDLAVRLKTEKRRNLEDVQQLLVPTPAGTQVPLYILADVAIKDGPNQIQREDAKRRIVVGFNVRSRDVQSVVNELQLVVDKNLRLPTGYYITYGGAFENLRQAKDRLSIAVPVSLLLIFFLLYFAFNSIKQGLLIYSAIPLSAIGGIFLLALRGLPFSISAGVGFIALFGVAVLNGIVLIAEFNRLRKDGEQDVYQTVLKGTKVRLRPVLMTALVASLGFLPMALSKGAGAEVQRPLATVVIGGLLLATFLTLFVLPILYVLFEKPSKNKPMSKSMHVVSLLFVALSLPQWLTAQQKFTLQQAMDSAISRNLLLKQDRLKVDYHQQMLSTAVALPGSSIFLEAGQLNSAFIDNKMGISQSFYAPGYYKKQKQLLQSEKKIAESQTGITELSVKKDVASLFYRLLVLEEREKLWMRSDSLLSAFEKRSRLRVNEGESSQLELSTASIQRGAAQVQLQNIRRDIKKYQTQLVFLLNLDELPIPVSSDFRYGAGQVQMDSALMAQHPWLQWGQDKQKQYQAMTGVEKSKLMPEFTLGYTNMSIRGIGADDKFYDASKRFHTAQLGIAIPLFTAAQKARIRSSMIQARIAGEEMDYLEKKLRQDWNEAVQDYQVASAQLQYFQDSGIREAKQIEFTATRQLQQGEINFLDWVQLINQSIHLQQTYFDAVQQYNDAAIAIQFLTAKF